MLKERSGSHQILYTRYNRVEEPSEEITFSALTRVSLRESNSLSPVELSIMWQIGLKTAKNIILATTHKCIHSTSTLALRFKTDKSQLRYKQLSRYYGTFYVDFLKVNVKAIRGDIGGMLYCNKLGFKNFFPCTSETQDLTVALH